jgi:uncharacterized protein (TIGR00299 family) protein
MVKIAYLDCPTGIAGDMCLGALVDVGVPLEYLVEQLERLGISQEYKLWTEQAHRNGQRATKFHVELLLASGESSNPDAFTTFDHATHSAHDHSDDHSHPKDLPHPSHLPHPPDHPFEHSHSHKHSHTHPPSPHAPLPSPLSPLRNLPEIEQLILSAQLPDRATAWSLAVFRKLAEAEGSVHGIPPEQVHFHEVGATDALVDIIGTCLGLDWLGIEQIYCGALPVGGGTIRAAHGRLPVPSPAVLKLFQMGQVPIYNNGIDRELVTPTGAAIATTLASQFGPPPAMVLQQVGLGAGSQELALPNILRLWIGETEARGQGAGSRGQGAESRETGRGRQPMEDKRQKAEEQRQGPGEKGFLSIQAKIQNLKSPCPTPHSPVPTPHLEEVIVLETQIDDLSPQAIGYVFEELLAAGALDVFTQAIAMKKSRPGVLLTVICRTENVGICEGIMFRETTTLGIRRSRQQRQILPREIQVVQTPYGPVRIKLAWSNEVVDPAIQEPSPPTNIQPEYEDCAQIARQHHLPWRAVHQVALQSWDPE